MPASVRDVGTLALRKLGVLRSGGEPSTADAEAARQSLESWYAECIQAGTFGRVANVVVANAGSFDVEPSVHVSATTDGVDIDLPATVPADHWNTWRPCRDYGWGKHIPIGGDPDVIVPRDKAVVAVTTSTNVSRATYVFDRTVQRWMRTDIIALSDEAPLSARGVDGLASVLALRLTEQFGSELAGAQTIRSAARYQMALVSDYHDEDC